MEEKKERVTWKRVLTLYVPLAASVIFIMFPLIWAMFTSVKTTGQIRGAEVQIFPNPIVWENYANVWKQSKIQTYFGNSLMISVISVLGIMFLSICNGYALSRFQFKGKKLTTVILLCTQLLPVSMLIIPLFVIFKGINLVNTRTSVIIFYIVNNIAFTSILMKGFIDGIPLEIEEASKVDGCSRADCMIKIVMPLLIPGIVAGSAMAFVHCWNEFLVAFSFIQKQAYFTISVALKYMISEFDVNFGNLAAGSMIALSIPVALFAYIQKFLVGGLSAGSVKG